MQKVDILLPIYNSYDETLNCIESILKHTPEGSYNLYLLDDNSPDQRIEELTFQLSNKHQHITVIRNMKNLGFPENVNNGLRSSKNDVVIINSDTLVTNSWLEVLVETAYLDEKIAAVNPMSNYGNISGVPTLNNEINDLFSYEELVAAFVKSNLNGYVEAPLLIGFCMYVKRSALQRVGLFDSETFKRGYGEESDWCMRARKLEYKLVVAKGSYVHHIGGVSFGEEKEKLRNQSREILLTRYPGIDQELVKYVKENTLKDIRKMMCGELHLLKKNTNMKLKLKIIKNLLKNYL
ncbi:glycosyltransferase family 2 protein [Neobacillus niacini]|uniref:glycosyltransferase family 2 protein n=1 Tax=Neobacillus niacini TaxID=86668 RepID=UPI00203F0E91|nr:glycosyltransferase [Neobacillus niacini]MCM3693178.1 glycosyltransferase [Neobacillus niacini]